MALTAKKAKDRCWRIFSRYIRLKYSKDGLCECFTCGVNKPISEMQCGHGIGGRGNFVLFLEEICRPQCFQCNVRKGGVYEIFIPKLMDLYTKEQYEEWVRQSKQVHKRTLEDYLQLESDLKKQIYALESQQLETV